MKIPPTLPFIWLSTLAMSHCLSAVDPSANDAASEGIFSAKSAGAKGEAVTDDTAAIQRALDDADEVGGRAWLPGRYFVAGSLRIPPGVTLEGVMESPVWRSFVSLSDCYLSSLGRAKNPGVSLVEADGGIVQIRGCSFGTDEPAIALRPGLRHAIITENNGLHGVEIANGIGDQAIISNNEPFSPLRKSGPAK